MFFQCLPLAKQDNEFPLAWRAAGSCHHAIMLIMQVSVIKQTSSCTLRIETFVSLTTTEDPFCLIRLTRRMV